MIKTAVVAFGFSAPTFHIPFLMADPRFQLTHIVSSKVESVQQDFETVKVVPQLDQLSMSDLDLVVITSPNHLHFEQAKYCLEQGCHVIVEKPFVLSSEQAIELQVLAQKCEREIIVFQNRRWDGDFLTVCSLIESQAVGTVRRLTSRFDRFRPSVRERWREQKGPGAGILWDLGPHLLDQVVSLFGKPSTITADVKALRTGSVVDDNFEIWLSYPDVEVILSSSSFQAGPNARFQLEGDEGTFIKYGLDVQEDALKKGADVTDERWGHETEDAWGILYQESKSRILTTKPGNYGVFWHQVASCLLDGNESPVPISESVLVIRLIELAHESAIQGKRLTVD